MYKLILLLNTLKFLKLKQICFRVFYIVRAKFRKSVGFRYNMVKDSKSMRLNLDHSIEYYSKFTHNEFKILNLSIKFNDNIDWNYSKFGKLWTYNLNYFEYLNDKNNIWLIYDFIDNISLIKDGLEPFPISLRGLNWIKFISKFDIRDKKIDDSLYAQYYILADNLEYHLCGNHLLENGFSLLFGAYYFQDEALYYIATNIIKHELNEQILADGAHFELSPMYHQLMLFRLLDCINLVKNNDWKTDQLYEFLVGKASLMIAWLKNISYSNGDIPLFNDSSNKIAPRTSKLMDYALRLDILKADLSLKESGYRKISRNRYECIVDIGDVKATYIPGHTHADTFGFELRIDGASFIVDCGIGTYTFGALRSFQRSTKAHNTVEINGANSSEVWGGFRVANRARVFGIKENENYIQATHDGYRKFGVLHTRIWKFEDDKIIISDNLNKKSKAVFRLYFHPDITEEVIRARLNASCENIEFYMYEYMEEFNTSKQALMTEIKFEQNIEINIKI